VFIEWNKVHLFSTKLKCRTRAPATTLSNHRNGGLQVGLCTLAGTSGAACETPCSWIIVNLSLHNQCGRPADLGYGVSRRAYEWINSYTESNENKEQRI